MQTVKHLVVGLAVFGAVMAGNAFGDPSSPAGTAAPATTAAPAAAPQSAPAAASPAPAAPSSTPAAPAAPSGSSAAAPASGQIDENSPNYVAGYSDGCASSNLRYARQAHVKPNRDATLYANDDGYHAGWDHGYRKCEDKVTPGGIAIPGNSVIM